MKQDPAERREQKEREKDRRNARRGKRPEPEREEKYS
jgi:hypothetical protein